MRHWIVGLLMLMFGIAQAAELPADYKCRPACERPNRESAKLCFGPVSRGMRDGILIVDGDWIEGTTDKGANKFTSDDGQVHATISLDAFGNPIRIEVNGTSYETCTSFGEGSVSVHN
ncbi:MAG: hypothetical protein NDI61_01735 [Bdellovibrionaceae bacterium]|nr:hypothetical protein [Pseudobdellovibrionaceae bacterium]